MMPVPLSACAMLAGLPGECTKAGQKTHCHHTAMNSNGGVLVAQYGGLCCHVNNAPLPEAKPLVSPDLVEWSFTSPSSPVVMVVPNHFVPAPSLPTSLSPPETQPLLCVFLI